MSNKVIYCGFCVALTAISGLIRIPFIPVPFTLQSSTVLVCAALFGPGIGTIGQIIFLILGLAGLPFFAQGGGPVYFLQPTFGYLLAFPIASYVVGRRLWSRHAIVNDKAIFLIFGLGILIIHSLGVGYLYLNINFFAGKSMTLIQAFWSGSIIFLPGEMIKIVFSVLLVRRLLPLLQSDLVASLGHDSV